MKFRIVREVEADSIGEALKKRGGKIVEIYQVKEPECIQGIPAIGFQIDDPSSSD